VAHGGVVSSLLDATLGAAVISSMPREWWCATVSLTIQYLGGARHSPLRASGRVLRRGRRVAFAEGEIRDARGKVVATAHGTWNLWPYHPERERSEGEPFVVVQGTGERVRVGKILAVGLNYPLPGEASPSPEEEPLVFLKPPSALLADGGCVRAPEGSGPLRYEAELVAVVGERCRSVPATEALERLLGYAVGLDMTLAELYAEAKRRGAPRTFAKGFDTSAPVSLVVPRDEVPDEGALRLSLDLNGERVQEASAGEMLRPVAELVSLLSRRMTLEPGDLIFTGTPAGAGRARPGDLLEARLEGHATLTVRVREAESERD
jgi:uncharacterized protein (TIGR00369 family)